MEFLIADALAQGADTLVTQGATQSNHVRQTAAAACRYGLKCHALLERRVTNMGDSYENEGNIILNDILNCTYEYRANGIDMNRETIVVAEGLLEAGRRPYVIPGGGSNPTGALGYAACAAEILGQADDAGLKIDYLFHATGSAGTQAGLLAGFYAMNAPIPIVGISVRAARDKQVENVHRLAKKTIDLLGARGDLPRESVIAEDDQVGPGYGQPTDTMIEAIALMAEKEGIFLDPVYSGKGFAGLIAQIRNGSLKKGHRVVFLHTGGSAALFAYRNIFKKKSDAYLD